MNLGNETRDLMRPCPMCGETVITTMYHDGEYFVLCDSITNECYWDYTSPQPQSAKDAVIRWNGRIGMRYMGIKQEDKP